MPKRLKFHISRVIRSFQSCRSKDPSSLPSNPVPTFRCLSTLNHKFPDAFATPTPPSPQPRPPSRPPHSSIKRRLAVSVGCARLRSRRSTTSSSSAANRNESSSDFKWRKEDKWHVIAKIHDEAPRRKIYNSAASGVSDDDDDVVIPPLPPPFLTEIQKRRSSSSSSRKKKTTIRLRLSTSSADSGLFSSEGREGRQNDGEETETLVSSSRSFSTDSSSEYNPHLETIREGPTGIKRSNKKKPKKRRVARKRSSSSSRSSMSSVGDSVNVTPARLSVFQRLIPCTVEGKVRESFAVVKKTEDPYEDFRRSMMEMILEKEMFEERDLEQMLHCFLSLNSRHHHEVIVGAFSEIWEALFCKSPGGTNPRNSDAL
ncbi:hypothetical protein Ancab_003662 [Ancistrocladus abbreviatus]